MADTPVVVTPPAVTDPAHPSHPIWAILGTVLQLALVAVVPFIKSPGSQQLFQFEGSLLGNLLSGLAHNNPPTPPK